MERVETRLAEARDSLPPGLARATERRQSQSRKRSEQALDADTL